MAKDKGKTDWININRKQDGDEIMNLITEFAEASHLKPTTAIKQYLLQTLPAKIQAIRADAKPSDDSDNAN